MSERTFMKIGGFAAFVLAASSILYAVAYLIITPADQRKSDVDVFFTSFADKPLGRQLANVFFVTGGLSGAWATYALARRLRAVDESTASLAATVGVVANLAGAAYGIWNISRLHELSKLYATEANRAAINVAFHTPAALDPLGFFRFAAGGVVGLLIGRLILRQSGLSRTMGWVAVALGVDSVILFAVSWADINALVLLTGAIASLVLLPWFWAWAGMTLSKEEVT